MTTITFETVSTAADNLVANGEKPTLASVRTALGGGSYSTISPLLKQWREQQMIEKTSAPIIESAPEEVTEQAKNFGDKVWQVALELANARLATEREALEKTRLALEDERNEAAELSDSLAEELESMTAERDQLQQDLNAQHKELVNSQEQAAASALEMQKLEHLLQSEAVEKKAALERSTELSKLLSLEQTARSKAETESKAAGELAAELRGRLSELEKQVKLNQTPKN